MKKIKKIARKILEKLQILKIRKTADSIIKKQYSLFHNVEFLDSTIGNYSYIARNSIVHATQIGNFCSIGPNVVIGYGDHPTDFLSTSPVFYSQLTDFDLKPKSDLFFGKQKVVIENDVWIGANVFIKNGVTISNGAIIGAGAVILADVAPFSIVVGVPGKEKSKRFSSDIIEKIIQIAWWNWPVEQIRKHHDLLSNSKITAHLEQLIEIKSDFER